MNEKWGHDYCLWLSIRLPTCHSCIPLPLANYSSESISFPTKVCWWWWAQSWFSSNVCPTSNTTLGRQFLVISFLLKHSIWLCKANSQMSLRHLLSTSLHSIIFPFIYLFLYECPNISRVQTKNKNKKSLIDSSFSSNNVSPSRETEKHSSDN